MAEALEQALRRLPAGGSDDPSRFAEIPGHTMTAEEVGALKCIRLSQKRVRELAGEGAFPGAYRQGRTWMIPPNSVRAYLRRLQRETAVEYGFDPETTDGRDRSEPDAVFEHIVTTEASSRGSRADPASAAAIEPLDPDSEMEFDAYKEEFDD